MSFNSPLSFNLSAGGRQDLSLLRATNALPRLRVLTPAQFATLEYLVEIIHPPDGILSGAMDSRAADYIDILLSESDDVTRLQWLNGLAELDTEAIAGFGCTFGRLDDHEKKALVAELYRRWPANESALESFVHLVEQATVYACYDADLRAGH